MIEDKPSPSKVVTAEGNNNLLGIGFMIGGMFMLALMDAVAKWLVEEDISPVQVLAVRSWVIVSIMIMVLFARKKIHLLKTKRPVAHAFRGALGFF